MRAPVLKVYDAAGHETDIPAIRGKQGETGEKGDPGDPSTVTLNGVTYSSVEGNIDLGTVPTDTDIAAAVGEERTRASDQEGALQLSINGKQDRISDLETIRSGAAAVSGKEDAGKITIDSTVYTAAKHTVVIVTDGVTTTFDLVGVN